MSTHNIYYLPDTHYYLHLWTVGGIIETIYLIPSYLEL